MDSIFIFKMHMNWTGKYISINKLEIQYWKTLSVLLWTEETESSTCVSTTSILHLSITSSQHKGKLGKNTVCSKGQSDVDSSISKYEATMDYSFLSLQFILLQCIQGVPHIALERGNGGSNLSILTEFGRPRVKLCGCIWEKLQKYLHLCTHPNVRGFEVKRCVYTRLLL